MTRKISALKKRTKDNTLEYINKIVEILKKPEMGVLPGQLAFFMLLSLVPIITLIGYGAGLFNINMDTIIDLLNKIVPGGAEALVPYISGNSIDLFLTIMFIWMFYLASNAFNTVIVISNRIYGIDKSNWFKRRIKAIIMTLVLVLMIIIVLLVPVYGHKILEIFDVIDFLNISDAVVNFYHAFKIPLTWLTMFIVIRSIYEISPDRVRKNSHLNTGALFTSIGWSIVTAIYTIMAKNVATYNIFYGALSNIAFLMLWLYFMSFIFVIGLCLNYGQEQEQEVIDKTGAVKIIKNR